MTQQQTERDETPIDEKRILADILEAITKLGTVGPWHDDLLRAAMLLRGDEPAKQVEVGHAGGALIWTFGAQAVRTATPEIGLD